MSVVFHLHSWYIWLRLAMRQNNQNRWIAQLCFQVMFRTYRCSSFWRCIIVFFFWQKVIRCTEWTAIYARIRWSLPRTLPHKLPQAPEMIPKGSRLTITSCYCHTHCFHFWDFFKADHVSTLPYFGYWQPSVAISSSVSKMAGLGLRRVWKSIS